jgi:hypothetical protein
MVSRRGQSVANTDDEHIRRRRQDTNRPEIRPAHCVDDELQHDLAFDTGVAECLRIARRRRAGARCHLDIDDIG